MSIENQPKNEEYIAHLEYQVKYLRDEVERLQTKLHKKQVPLLFRIIRTIIVKTSKP